MTLLEELEILIETRQPYAHGNAEKCYPFVADLIQSLRAAQQGVQATVSLSGAQAQPDNNLIELDRPASIWHCATKARAVGRLSLNKKGTHERN